ncbi:HdeD family acid-resistance protein [Streptomyces luteolus]|uniref:DUF308 domain-containing protein n=1 Tax=Streptomyces luteolus TaxID=3043615 RepID=A0ABT6SQ04_9ACTN|nr:DUF308 domain-containing protein [Streptomyces sp. B-S-A12]MDI3417693.1 DUF308 domain-containing protein [Streptomyces sp. B-S-A12]
MTQAPHEPQAPGPQASGPQTPDAQTPHPQASHPTPPGEGRTPPGEGRTPPGEGRTTPPGAPGPLGLLARSTWPAILLAGLASLVLGVLVLVWPGASLLAAGVFFGLYLIVSGVFQLVSAFGSHVASAMRIITFISGALSVLLGLFCFRGPMQSLLLLALWIGIGWLFRGITQTVAALSDPDMPARGWQVFLGIVSAVAGAVLIVSPFESVAVLTVWGGVWLVVMGVVEIVTALQVRSRAKRTPAGV